MVYPLPPDDLPPEDLLLEDDLPLEDDLLLDEEDLPADDDLEEELLLLVVVVPELLDDDGLEYVELDLDELEDVLYVGLLLLELLRLYVELLLAEVDVPLLYVLLLDELYLGCVLVLRLVL